MLELILKLYSMYMAVDVRTPVPHLFGPPGCGKSTSVEQAAALVGKQLHVINVSRISPLDLEGVQMPHGTGEEMILKMLPATFWTQLQHGDIILFDEFLRGFPEVYNGLLDIFTARKVGAFKLPRVFIIAASNSTVSYDKALEDRLLHLPVPDPRKIKRVKNQLAELIVNQLGLLPEMKSSGEMITLLDTEVLPMYDVLDALGNKSSAPASLKGKSVRNLIGQAQLRQVETPALAELLQFNNARAAAAAKWQYMFFVDGKQAAGYASFESKAKTILGDPSIAEKLTELQALNLRLNLELIEIEAIRNEKEGSIVDESELDDIFS